MRQFHVPGGPDPRPEAGGLRPGEKRKILAMAIGVLLVAAALLYNGWRQGNAENQDLQGVPLVSMEETISLPELDGAAIDALVQDAEPLDRVVLESEAVDILKETARRLTPRAFEELGTRELDAGLLAEIEAAPSAHRSQPFFARGIVDSLRTRNRGADVEHIGRLRLDDESLCYFLVLDLDDAPENGAYVRVDGLFLKVYSQEDELEAGAWIEAPLLVGPRALRSYRAYGEVTELDPSFFTQIEDANLVDEENRNIVEETPFEPLWHLMAYARDVPEGAIDWEAAPELDGALLDQLLDDPEAWRLQPIRIPISRVQDGRVLRAGENPARIAAFTQGWMGNWGWNNVVKFVSPVPDPKIQLEDMAFGRGFFLHDFAYPSAGRGVRVAPLVVLNELVRFEQETDPIWAKLGAVFGAGTVVLILLFVLLLRRDRQRSAELQSELVRRRRARRSRKTTASQPSA